MSNEAQTVRAALDRQATQLRQLLARADQLSRIQALLRELLDEPWADALRVANLRGTTLILHAENGAIATALRHRQQDLIARLSHRLGHRLDQLEIKVRPAPRLGVS
jgi:hypothetical protein